MGGIQKWIMGGIGGILGIDLLKNNLEKSTDFIKKGKDRFFAIIDDFSL
jgi:hypothetical protein